MKEKPTNQVSQEKPWSHYEYYIKYKYYKKNISLNPLIYLNLMYHDNNFFININNNLKT